MKTAIKQSLALSIAFAILGINASPSKAQESTFFSVDKLRFYEQIDDNDQSLVSIGTFLSTGLFFYRDDLAYEDVALELLTPDLELFSLTPVTQRSSGTSVVILEYDSSGFVDETLFEESFPRGSTFKYTLAGGDFDSDGDSVFLTTSDSNNYPEEIPFLTGTSFSDLQNFDPAQALTVTFNGFTEVPDVLLNQSSFLVVQENSLVTDFRANFLPSTQTSLEIPANTLEPNTDYLYFLTYQVTLNPDTSSSSPNIFSSGNEYFRSGTRGNFTTGGTGIGTTPENPFLPISTPSGGFTFLGIVVNEEDFFFFDPDVAVGYDYTVTGGPLFSEVLIPDPLPNGDSDFLLELAGFGDFPLMAGSPFDLLAINPNGFSDFRISGIDTTEMLDPQDPLAFVTGLGFTESGTVTVTQNPVVQNIPDATGTPEPSTILSLLSLGILGGVSQLKSTKK